MCHRNHYDSTDLKYLFSREVASFSDLTILRAEVYTGCCYDVYDSERIFLNSETGDVFPFILVTSFRSRMLAKFIPSNSLALYSVH